MPTAPSSASVSLSEVLSALSYALDLTEGQPMGHTVRTCLIGMRLAEEVGLSVEERSALYYALLLKDAGCSSNAAKMTALFGSDDRVVKPYMKTVDWHRRWLLAGRTALAVGRGRSLAEKVGYLRGLGRQKDVTKDLIAIRCERGAEIARQLGFPASTSDAIRSLDEHWNGLGYSEGLRGSDIPLLARIANLSQTIEAFHNEGGVDSALRVAKTRRATWFDPKLVDTVLKWRKDSGWWKSLRDSDANEAVLSQEPGKSIRLVDEDGLDTICHAFAEIIDAKSPYTFRHSSNVASYAAGIARRYGHDAAAQRRMQRAGLLHDIGKLGISNSILDKPGRLDDRERAAIEQHPVFTNDILSHVTAFNDFAWTAALHHERLDGTGYPWRLREDQLDLPARIICVADVAEALTADRPYRAGMPTEAAFALMRKEFRGKLCGETVDVLESCFDDGRSARDKDGLG